MLNKKEYLYKRGWCTDRDLVYSNRDIVENDLRWYKIGGHQNLDLDAAVNLQLAEDAEIRDFVDSHRPKLSESK